MTVSSWTISGGGNSRNVASQEPFSFAIGGTLAVNANQAEGPWGTEWVGSEELEDELLSAPSLWEAEVAALSDEQLAALEETSEDL